MNRLAWKEICRKTKWASKKKRLGKKELGDLMSNVITLQGFMATNKSDFANVNRKEVFKKRNKHETH